LGEQVGTHSLSERQGGTRSGCAVDAWPRACPATMLVGGDQNSRMEGSHGRSDICGLAIVEREQPRPVTAGEQCPARLPPGTLAVLPPGRLGGLLPQGSHSRHNDLAVFDPVSGAGRSAVDVDYGDTIPRSPVRCCETRSWTSFASPPNDPAVSGPSNS
jgi:hypothetical protein